MRRYRIGLMAGNKSIDYVHAIRMGVQNTLEDMGHTLVVISDLIPFHSRHNSLAFFRVAFQIAARLDLDIIIVPAGIIAGYLANDHDTLLDLLGMLDSHRMLVIERSIPGYRCVAKDNATGMHECMQHLIDTCGYKNIAFIGGPQSSSGAREREDVYREEMAAHGLVVRDTFVERGDFSGECGDSIDKIIDNNPGLEAIVCCCDLIAHSVYEVMRRRRLLVGRDIAVTGFDDHVMSARLDPPLSTVHMTGYDLGCMAAREAVRYCECEQQREFVLASNFIVRGSCGSQEGSVMEEFRAYLRKSPLPVDDMVERMVDATLTMANDATRSDFTNATHDFFHRMRLNYRNHLEHPGLDDQLFSPRDLNLLFHKPYMLSLSLEGFQAVALALMQALARELSPKEANWVISQISNLHLGIARLRNIQMQERLDVLTRREWVAFHITDDAIRMSTTPREAYRLILQDFKELGIRSADLFLLPEPVSAMGVRAFALSDNLLPLGTLRDNSILVPDNPSFVSLQGILDHVLPVADSSSTYVVSGIMAGSELLGVAVIDGGTLDCDGQLVAFLNLGVALKHIQMIADDREANELLSRSNLVLKLQSNYDEMTGVLNRRGFYAEVHRSMARCIGQLGCLFYLDLDGLKEINDTFGHDSGDEAIKETARILNESLPSDAIVGRLGGDEFAAFCIVGSEAQMDELGRTVQNGMYRHNKGGKHAFELGISYGGVCMRIDDGTFDNLSRHMVEADEKLYRMKKEHGPTRHDVQKTFCVIA